MQIRKLTRARNAIHQGKICALNQINIRRTNMQYYKARGLELKENTEEKHCARTNLQLIDFLSFPCNFIRLTYEIK